ncbi:sigma-54 interaction domain-containing protein [Fusibacter ferrireducens]|uniref:Sigma 54-interacting transcriptional regulator n=1 Tax=Fusibacter ferrireducens TaxID=2785058 RepID=A0ABR9ZRB8_9FIRM|nr:sigma 54-interacting transcriptional regulator [Fusibacter ferrireducens]MBF4692871.1 sigma 54-interacting transcriptional regulator [Fusibacter ferrireducens]
MKLDKVIQNAQMICDAIASVIDIDVTIVDETLMRIAGTGRYQESIGENVSDHSAFSYAIKTGSEFIIENPGDHLACKMCDCKNKCSEHAEVCCPIKWENETIGVIGLIAFEKTQRDHIIENQKNLLQFLNRMAELIASKVNEQEAVEEMALLAKELEIVVDAIDSGFIAIRNDGKVIRANHKILKMVDKERLESLSDLLDPKEVEIVLNAKRALSNRSYRFNAEERGLYDVSLIQIGAEIKGYVITFRTIEDVINTVNEVLLDVVTTRFEHIIGHSDALCQAKAMAGKVAGSTSTVLILGESGTGKELFARAIHQASQRQKKPFVAVNCAAIPEQLLESELFGYEEGAFTGAKKGGKPGKFQLANKGTLFLDEIGDMPLHLQAKLLRVLQENQVERLGGKTPIAIDVRIIAATNQDLELKVDEGAFRKDLYYRLNVIPITVPPLRNRKEDIPELVWTMVRRASQKLGKSIGSIEETCFDHLNRYDWPGNVRELENTIEYAVNMCDDHTLRMQCLPKKLQKKHDGEMSDVIQHRIESKVEQLEFEEAPLKASQKTVFEFETLAELEKRSIIAALEYYRPYKKSAEKAAKVLGISRAKLYRKIAEYKLNEANDDEK